MTDDMTEVKAALEAQFKEQIRLMRRSGIPDQKIRAVIRKRYPKQYKAFKSELDRLMGEVSTGTWGHGKSIQGTDDGPA
jgi:hypothetical protein